MLNTVLINVDGEIQKEKYTRNVANKIYALSVAVFLKNQILILNTVTSVRSISETDITVKYSIKATRLIDRSLFYEINGGLSQFVSNDLLKSRRCFSMIEVKLKCGACSKVVEDDAPVVLTNLNTVMHDFCFLRLEKTRLRRNNKKDSGSFKEIVYKYEFFEELRR